VCFRQTSEDAGQLRRLQPRQRVSGLGVVPLIQDEGAHAGIPPSRLRTSEQPWNFPLATAFGSLPALHRRPLPAAPPPSHTRACFNDTFRSFSVLVPASRLYPTQTPRNISRWSSAREKLPIEALRFPSAAPHLYPQQHTYSPRPLASLYRIAHHGYPKPVKSGTYHPGRRTRCGKRHPD
jgi:hypothetical protein